jgi:hypothetical protein
MNLIELALVIGGPLAFGAAMWMLKDMFCRRMDAHGEAIKRLQDDRDEIQRDLFRIESLITHRRDA